ncbi:MAG: hypothetical protein JSU92_09970, partial [Deltaproteobacteria bacterium]
MKKMSYLLILSGLIFALSLLGEEALAQEEIAVFDLQPIGVDPNTSQVVSRMLRQELGREGRFKVLDRSKMVEKLGEGFACYDATCASENGRKLGVAKAVVGGLSKLGEKTIMDVKLVDVEIGKVELYEKLATAKEEDLDTVAKRLAVSLSTGKKAEDTITTETVTEEEAKEVTRRKALFLHGLRVGGKFPLADAYGNLDTMYKIEWLTWYELKDLALELISGIHWGTKENGSDTLAIEFPIDFGLNYFLLKGDFSPFFGGGIGLHWVSIEKDLKYAGLDEYSEHGWGFALHGTGGLVVFRTSNIRGILDVRYDYN